MEEEDDDDAMDSDDGDNAMLLTFLFLEHSAPEPLWANAGNTIVNGSKGS